MSIETAIEKFARRNKETLKLRRAEQLKQNGMRLQAQQQLKKFLQESSAQQNVTGTIESGTVVKNGKFLIPSKPLLNRKEIK